MKKNFTYFFVILFCFCGINCRTYDIDNFHLKEPVEPLIAPLKIEIDNESFSKNYDTVLEVSGHSSRASGESFIMVQENSGLLGEAAIICKRELRKFLGESTSRENHGFAVFRIKNRNHSVEGFWFFTSLLSICTLNLLGYPISSHTATFEVELEIFDSLRNSIAKYSAEGKATKYAALYWGYSALDNGFLRATKISGDIPVAQATNVQGLMPIRKPIN